MSERPKNYYKVRAGISATFEKRFDLKVEAEAFIHKLETKLAAANKVADGEIWTSVELVYLCRWDCPTPRLAAAI